MTRPKIYELSTTPTITLTTVDDNGDSVSPTYARLTFDYPDGTTFTVSGAAMTDNTTYLSYTFTPTVSGTYIYEGWVVDASGREASDTHQFVIVDRT
jgi:hypothetical protein